MRNIVSMLGGTIRLDIIKVNCYMRPNIAIINKLEQIIWIL